MTDGEEDYRLALRARALKSTYVFSRSVCQFTRLKPSLHGAMAQWIDSAKNKPIRKCGVAPRGHYKTSVWTIGHKLRLATQDPQRRILLLNETQDNTEKWIGKMQAIVTSPVYRWLFPDKVPDFSDRKVRWNKVQLELRRSEYMEQATVEGFGVGGASTSNHYNIIGEDDLVGRKALDSEPEMQKGIDQHKLTESLTVDPEEDEVDYVGTPWGRNDVIAYMLETEPHLDLFRISIYDEFGNIRFPERFSPQYIEFLKGKYGPSLFSLMYLTEALADGTTVFNPAHLRRYKLIEVAAVDAEPGKKERAIQLMRPPGEGGNRVVRLKACTLFQTIDLNLNPESPDARTASITVALTPPVVGPDGIEIEPFNIVLLGARAKACDPPSALSLAYEDYERFDPSVAGMEVFGGHVYGYHWALARYPRMRLTKLPQDSQRSKNTRIREFYPFVVQHRFWLPLGGLYDFEAEYEAYPGGRTVDLLDALAWSPAIWWPPDPVTETGEKAPLVVPGGMTREEYDEQEWQTERAEQHRDEVTGY